MDSYYIQFTDGAVFPSTASVIPSVRPVTDQMHARLDVTSIIRLFMVPVSEGHQ